MKIIIIGAGISSLTLAVQLVKDHHEVIVIDKNSRPGGVMALYQENGFSFEQGPLLIGDMNPEEAMYELLKSINVTLPTQRCDRGLVLKDYRFIKPDRFEGKNWRRDLAKKYFPQDAAGIDEYYRFYEALMRIRFLSLQKPSLFNKLKTALTFMSIRKYQHMSCDEFTKALFSDPDLRAVYTGILADFCVDPKEINCFSIPFVNAETAFDDRIDIYDHKGRQYYPAFNYVTGGVQKIPEALAEYIEKHGGTFLYNTTVTKINIENNTAKSVLLDNGKTIDADVIVSSGGAHEVFYKLIGKEYLTDEYDHILQNLHRMEAVFMLHLGVDYDPMQYQKQALVYYYGTSDLEGATYRLRNNIYHNGDDGFLIFIDSFHAPEFAPEGKHCITIYTVAPNIIKDSTWEQKKEEYAERLISLAEKHLPELHKHIVFKKVITADYYKEYTNTDFFSFGGLVPADGQVNPPHKTPIKNFYFIGSQSESNGGITPTSSGGYKVYDLIKSTNLK